MNIEEVLEALVATRTFVTHVTTISTIATLIPSSITPCNQRFFQNNSSSTIGIIGASGTLATAFLLAPGITQKFNIRDIPIYGISSTGAQLTVVDMG